MRAVGQCLDCWFWSDMIAKCEGSGPVQAMCLNRESPKHLKYTVSHNSCDKWEDSMNGFRVDSPGEELS